MKRRGIFCTVLACMLTTACMDKDKFISTPNDGKEELDLSFDFSMKSEKQLTITAKSGQETIEYGIPFYVYLESPYTDEGDHRYDILPIYSGETNQNGILNATITVPNVATTLYIYTPFSSYGMMQTCNIENNMNVTFTNIFAADAKSVKSRAQETIFTGTRQGKVISAKNNLYSFYKFNINPSKGSYGFFNNNKSEDEEVLTIGNTLTQNEETWANIYFPEKKTVDDEKYLGMDYCTDLEIKRPSSSFNGTFEGAHVWVTFIGDGGFSNNNHEIPNPLCYYTYTDTPSGSDAANIHKTAIFLNTNVKKLTSITDVAIGAKVQLLYWDGEKYVDTFPEGVKIGWAMVSNGKQTQTSHLDDIGNYRFSTPILNSEIGKFPGCYAGGISRWCEEAQMNVVGMENRQHLDTSSSNDMDYNDILFKVTADPVIKPIDEVPVVPDNDVTNITGTLAFEDNWPEKGDYDFNDFVTSYTYSLVKDKNESSVKEIQLTFTPRALGAIYSSGFAIQLPVDAGNIAEVSGGRLENTTGKAIIIVYEDNRRDAFGGNGGFINTRKGSEYIAGKSVTVRIPLKSKITLDSFKDFNPFIYVGNRSHEIHLTDKAPTDKMDMTLLHTLDDRSDAGAGVYYRMDNTHPWVLDIPSSNNNKNSVWEYPIEESSISVAYPNYINWTNTDHNLNWLNNKKSEHIY